MAMIYVTNYIWEICQSGSVWEAKIERISNLFTSLGLSILGKIVSSVRVLSMAPTLWPEDLYSRHTNLKVYTNKLGPWNAFLVEYGPHPVA